MKNSADEDRSARLLDAYSVRGFRAQAKIDSYDLEPPAFVITLNRRSKKWFAVAAASDAGGCMTNAGAGRVTLAVVGTRFTSISSCAGSIARTAA